MKSRFTLSIFVIALLAGAIGCGGGSGPTAPGPNPGGLPVENYSLLFDGKTSRWPSTAFPLTVYVDPPPAEAGSHAQAMIDGAKLGIDTWDNVIPGIPDVFNYVEFEEFGNIIVRWEPGVDGAYTRVTEFNSHIEIHKIGIDDSIRHPASIKLLLGHELGHVLGLGHSEAVNDLMFPTVNPLKTLMTARDRNMIQWLYTRGNYIPITY
ncbi:MAG TPA: matrixin family metalloprotease [bacterium]|jgi:hypothetical protein